jgi:hypothetical protein
MVALIRIASDARTLLATHAALQLVDRGRLPPADYVERHGLIGVAADFEVSISGIEGIAQGRLLLPVP